jgi:3-deoxy-D-manno-octulosonic-acid transferase
MSILGDTIGEMGLYLNLTEIVFVGKVPHGRRWSKPSRTCNARLCGAFGQQGGEFPRDLCASAQEWRRALCPRWRNAGQGRALSPVQSAGPAGDGKGGEKTLSDMRGALKATIRALEPYINPLTVKARLLPRENENAETRAGGQW